MIKPQQIKDMFPQIDWDRFNDINDALDFELYYGPMPLGYWTADHVLEYYRWSGVDTAIADLRDTLDGLPFEIFHNTDTDELSETLPEDDDLFDWSKILPHQIVCKREVYRQVY